MQSKENGQEGGWIGIGWVGILWVGTNMRGICLVAIAFQHIFNVIFAHILGKINL